jgi:hypothetical protein
MQKFPESQYYDVGLHSYLINELKTANKMFAKIDKSKLTQYERNVLKEVFD